MKCCSPYLFIVEGHILHQQILLHLDVNGKKRHSLLAASQNSKNLYDGVSNACAIRSKVVNEIGLYIPAASI